LFGKHPSVLNKSTLDYLIKKRRFLERLFFNCNCHQ
jgi:hypothetical protein